MSLLDGEAVPRDDCTATRKRQIRQKAKKFAVMHILMLKVCSRPHWVKLVLAFSEPVSSEFVQVLNASFTLTLGDCIKHWVPIWLCKDLR